MYPRNVELPYNEQEIQLKERSLPACHVQQDESFDSTRVLAKKRRDRKSQLSDAMCARLRPQMPGMGGKLHIETTQEACPGTSAAPLVADWPAHWLIQQPVGGSGQ